MTLTAAANDGGAVTSLVYNGKEFIHSSHGEDLGFAYLNFGAGECNNPTQPGSANDVAGKMGTSQLFGVYPSGNALSTMSFPAYFLAPGQRSGNCPLAPGVGANTSLVATDQELDTTLTAGVNGDDHILQYDGTVKNQITVTGGFEFAINAATVKDINQLYVYLPYQGKFVQVDTAALHDSTGGYSTYGGLPMIQATPTAPMPTAWSRATSTAYPRGT